ncbi:MAG: right-handed parallel beta-helix repeat-containing protein [Kiritimatiellia bacterium]
MREGKWYFEQLWVNGVRATRARSPNTGFFNAVRTRPRAYSPAAGRAGPRGVAAETGSSRFHRPGSEFAALAGLTEAERPDAVVLFPHTWSVHHYRIQEMNRVERGVLMDGPMGYEILTHEQDGRYWIENFHAALDQPGEWFLSRNGELFYRPLPGEEIAGTEVIVPVADMLLKTDGANDVTFTGISFQHQNHLTPKNGYGEGQAAVSIAGALTFRRGTGIALDGCEIAHTGGYGVSFEADVRDSSLLHSHLRDLGGGGVKIGPFGGDPLKNPTGRITVDNCIIQHGGRIFPEAVGVLVTHSGGNRITQCDIGDFFYTAISAGWVWGYGESVAQGNLVENNHLHHLGWGVISDMGGVYLLGPAFGTVVRGNHIHDIASYRYGGWGLYTDEGSTGVLMENNLVHDTSESGFHQHYGYYNTVRNNIFAFGGRAQIQRSRPETHLGFIFENNIVAWNPDSKLLDGSKYNWDFPEKTERGYPRETYILRNNLYWPVGGVFTNKLAGEWTWADWQKSGRDRGSILADPRFADLAARDFMLSTDSPALPLGFKPWDLSLAGVRGEAWRAVAATTVRYPDFAERSRPWPAPDFEIENETFEYMDAGQCWLPRQEIHQEARGDHIGVTGDVAATGRFSLKFQDAKGLQFSYDPHLVLTPRYTNGVATVRFDFRFDPGAKFYFEWRDDGQDYKTGPSIHFGGDGTMRIKNGPAVEGIVAGQWMRLEMTAPLGPDAAGRCEVRLTLPGDKEPRLFRDISCEAGWTSFSRLVISMTSDADTALYLDNLSITRTAAGAGKPASPHAD